MKLYLYTPLYKNSTTIPSLLKNYFLYARDFDFYNKFCSNIDVNLFPWYTVFNNLPDNAEEFFREQINKEISSNVLNKEFEILKLSEPTTEEYVIERMWKLIYWKNFSITETLNFSNTEVTEYFQNFYQNPSYIITDDNHNLQKEYNFGKHNTKDCIFENKLKTKTVKFSDIEEKTIYSQIQNHWDVYYFLFIREFFLMQDEYFNRFVNKMYFHNDMYFYNFYEYLAEFSPYKSDFEPNQEFFEEFRNYFLKNFSKNYLKYIKIYSILLTWGYPPKSQIKEFVENIDFESLYKLIDFEDS